MNSTYTCALLPRYCLVIHQLALLVVLLWVLLSNLELLGVHFDLPVPCLLPPCCVVRSLGELKAPIPNLDFVLHFQHHRPGSHPRQQMGLG